MAGQTKKGKQQSSADGSSFRSSAIIKDKDDDDDDKDYGTEFDEDKSESFLWQRPRSISTPSNF